MWQQADALGIALDPAAAAVDTTAGAAPAGPGAIDPAQAGVVYAGLWRRTAASIIDSFVTAMLSYAVIIPLMLVFGLSLQLLAGKTGDASPAASIGFFVLAYGISIALPAAYFGWMQSSRHQASLGKLAVGIKVTRGDGGRTGFWRGFLRYTAYLLLTLLTCGVGAVVTAFMAGMTRRKQAPHDFACDTLVVDRWAFTDQPQRQQQGLDIVSIVILAAYAALILLSAVAVAAVIAVLGLAAR
ncbi:MAG TPA: hypothetical protein DDZ67_09755 [Xanthomonadaceae bacterium]|nr:hypothetical protein [Xanthomonadaceae bacterium]